MDKFFALESICFVCVTLKTHVVSGCVKELGKICLMRVMAHGTAADSNWSMYEFTLSNFLVVA